MFRYKIIFSAVVCMLLLSLVFSPGLEAQFSQNLSLDDVHYLVGTDLDDFSDFDINVLELTLTFGITRINSFASTFHYDAEDFDLQGVWLVNFTEGIPYDMNLRLNLSTIENFNSVEPALGLGVEFPVGESNYTYGNLDYYFGMDSPNLMYTVGLGIPITVNSNLTLSAGRSIWNRDSHQINIGMKIDL